MSNAGPRGTILGHLDDAGLLDLYIEYKRLDMQRMGMKERAIEQAIEAYVDWRNRYHAWEKAESLSSARICPYCKQNFTRKSTNSGVICRTCFMTRRQCDILGCRNIIIGNTTQCLEHQNALEVVLGVGGKHGLETADRGKRQAAIRSNLSRL